MWAVINLTWPEEEGAIDRIGKLESMGFYTSLLKMCSNTGEEVNMDVRERARTAVHNFEQKKVDQEFGDDIDLVLS